MGHYYRPSDLYFLSLEGFILKGIKGARHDRRAPFLFYSRLKRAVI